MLNHQEYLRKTLSIEARFLPKTLAKPKNKAFIVEMLGNRSKFCTYSLAVDISVVVVGFSTIVHMNFLAYVDESDQPSSVVSILMNHPVYTYLYKTKGVSRMCHFLRMNRKWLEK